MTGGKDGQVCMAGGEGGPVHLIGGQGRQSCQVGGQGRQVHLAGGKDRPVHLTGGQGRQAGMAGGQGRRAGQDPLRRWRGRRHTWPHYRDRLAAGFPPGRGDGRSSGSSHLKISILNGKYFPNFTAGVSGHSISFLTMNKQHFKEKITSFANYHEDLPHNMLDRSRYRHTKLPLVLSLLVDV
jgi:hypothetical protein